MYATAPTGRGHPVQDAEGGEVLNFNQTTVEFMYGSMDAVCTAHPVTNTNTSDKEARCFEYQVS
jgi:hypothetical protein